MGRFWHCIATAPAGQPPAENEYWEPDPGPEDGCARLGSVGVGGGASLEGSGALGYRISVNHGVTPDIYETGGWPFVEAYPGYCLSLYCTLELPSLRLQTFFAYVYMNAYYRCFLHSGKAYGDVLAISPFKAFADTGWHEFKPDEHPVLDPDETYWLCIGAPNPPLPIRNALGGSYERPQYAVWTEGESYVACNYVSYLGAGARPVLPLLKTTAMPSGLMLTGGRLG